MQTRNLTSSNTEVVLGGRKGVIEGAEHFAVLGVDVSAAVHQPHCQHIKLVLHKVVQRRRLGAVLHVQVCAAVHEQFHNLFTQKGGLSQSNECRGGKKEKGQQTALQPWAQARWSGV